MSLPERKRGRLPYPFCQTSTRTHHTGGHTELFVMPSHALAAAKCAIPLYRTGFPRGARGIKNYRPRGGMKIVLPCCLPVVFCLLYHGGTWYVFKRDNQFRVASTAAAVRAVCVLYRRCGVVQRLLISHAYVRSVYSSPPPKSSGPPAATNSMQARRVSQHTYRSTTCVIQEGVSCVCMISHRKIEA